MLNLGGELVSYIIANEKIYCGLSDNRIVVLNEETLEVLPESYETDNIVQRFLQISGRKGKKYIFCFQRKGTIQAISIE